MKKVRCIITLIISIIILLIPIKSSLAATVTLDNTAKTVNSQKDFEIVLSFSEKVSTFSAYVVYDQNLITLHNEFDNADIVFNENYSEGVASLLYAPLDESKTVDKIVIKATSKEVSEEKIAKIGLSSIIINNDKDDNKNFEITVKPEHNTTLSVDVDWISLNVGETKKVNATGNGVKWKSNNDNIAKVDQQGNITAISEGNTTITVSDESGISKEINIDVLKIKDSSQSNKNIAKTGENSIILISLICVGIISFIFGIRNKKISRKIKGGF